MRIAPAGRGPGPRRSGLLALVGAALALIATTPALPRLESSAIGEVGLTGGQPVEQAVRVHLDPEAVQLAARSGIRAGFLASNGLDKGYSSAATITIQRVGAPGPSSPFGGEELPLVECSNGCDLDYVVQVVPGPGVLPGSTARYRVDLEIEYESGYGDRPATNATIDLEQQATGPVPAAWTAMVGLIGLVVGWFAAARADAALARRRRWPAGGLAIVPVVALVALGVERLQVVGRFGLESWNVVVYLLEPWSLGLLGTLSWGVARGIRRWDVDGGWSLGLGAVALAGLGGLWLGWWTTLEPVGQPVIAGVGATLLGLLAGTVIGQGWRLDPRAAHDRLVAGAAVLSHGIVIAGFAFLGVLAVYDPISTTPGGPPLLIPAGLIALALRRWFRGGRAWLVLFDLLVAGVGLLGLWLFVLQPSLVLSFGKEAIDEVAIVLAVSAAILALVTAFHRMPGPAQPGVPAAEHPATMPAASPPTT